MRALILMLLLVPSLAFGGSCIDKNYDCVQADAPSQCTSGYEFRTVPCPKLGCCVEENGCGAALNLSECFQGMVFKEVSCDELVICQGKLTANTKQEIFKSCEHHGIGTDDYKKCVDNIKATAAGIAHQKSDPLTARQVTYLLVTLVLILVVGLSCIVSAIRVIATMKLDRTNREMVEANSQGLIRIYTGKINFLVMASLNGILSIVLMLMFFLNQDEINSFSETHGFFNLTVLFWLIVGAIPVSMMILLEDSWKIYKKSKHKK